MSAHQTTGQKKPSQPPTLKPGLLGQLANFLDDRTGYRALVHEALYERVPGGARWRYVWGSTLVFAFMTQVITGLVLWSSYAASAQTAWESVYTIQHEMTGGWLVRGIHHVMAQMMIVLLALHLMQVVIDGAYRAPREVNFWLGLVLMMLVLGMALTGYLLPWDQKGYWATRVATNLAGLVPLLGPSIQQVVVGGPDYGHHTLTRFFALHAGFLPATLVLMLVVHLSLFRKHGLCARQPIVRPDAMFWPDQVLKDAVAMLAVMALEKHGLTPADGPVVVTGAAGGVGSVAITLLAKLGWHVIASTGRTGEADYLKNLGAAEIIDRAELSAPGRALGKERWAAAVDSVGSHTLANLIAQTRYHGAVAACGLAQGMDLPASVAPFILRGVALLGIDSVMCPVAKRREAWRRLSADLDRAKLAAMTTHVAFDDVLDTARSILDGTVRGRVVVDIG
jgi:hypothetical protein